MLYLSDAPTPEPNPVNPNLPNHPGDQRMWQWTRMLIVICMAAVCIFVVLRPQVGYSTTSSLVLFVLLALMVTILIGGEVAARIQVQLPGLILSALGSGALFFGLLMFVRGFIGPEMRVAAYTILDTSGEEVPNLDRSGVVKVIGNSKGQKATVLIDSSTIYIVFPEQMENCRLIVRPVEGLPSYSGIVQFQGAREGILFLGSDLKLNSPTM